MTRLDDAPEIIELAAHLGVRNRAPVEGIVDVCRRRIDGWVADEGGVTDIDALEALVTRRLRMVFEEVRSDDDFERLTEVYARGKKEFVFAGLRTKFDDADNLTYGALVQRRNVRAKDGDQYVAVIDCRGNKLARRFFTRWHEIAHRLTTHSDMPEPVFRSEHEPIERLMDEIAGQIGFYEPILALAYSQASKGKRLLTLGTVEDVIATAFPAASFQATLFACSRRLSTPLIYLEAALAHKRHVTRKLAARGRLGETSPLGELRAVRVIPNQSAQQQRFTIPMNMRVPADSVIHRLFQADAQTGDEAQEDLSQWESHGKCLQARAVITEARKVPGRVIAIIQPVQPRLRKRRQSSREHRR